MWFVEDNHVWAIGRNAAGNMDELRSGKVARMKPGQMEVYYGDHLSTPRFWRQPMFYVIVGILAAAFTMYVIQDGLNAAFLAAFFSWCLAAGVAVNESRIEWNRKYAYLVSLGIPGDALTIEEVVPGQEPERTVILPDGVDDMIQYSRSLIKQDFETRWRRA